MKCKINNLPDFKHTPAAPEVFKKNTPEETASELLTSIRQHEPEEQNAIVITILKELATDRWNAVRSSREATMRAEKSADVFFTSSRSMEEIVKEMQSR